MKIKFSLAWYDIWIGVYVARKKRKIYICPLPCCVFEISREEKKKNKEVEFTEEEKELLSHLKRGKYFS